MMETIQKLFNNEFLCDKKHKINTTNKLIPKNILDTINQGITIEQIDELYANGFDIYKYNTQITLHGICKELKDNRVNYYQSLSLNNNGSIGIKWTAVDNKKKKKICNTLRYFGWNNRENSTEFYPFKIKRFANINDAIIECNNYKQIATRLDKDLFYGNYSIYIGSYLGMYYSIFDLKINGILEKNINKLLEQIVNLPINQINQKIKEITEEKKKKHDIFWANYKKETEDKKEKAKTYNEKFMQNINANYKKVNSLSLQNGDVFYVIKDSYDYKYQLIGYIYGKRTCKPIEFGANNQKYCKKNCGVYVKK